MTDETPWLTKAREYLAKGLHEGTIENPNPEVVRFFGLIGHPELVSDKLNPWCAAFVGACLKETGYALPRNTMWSLSYLRYGSGCVCKVGAIAVRRREGSDVGHVFFVDSFDDKFVYAIGGNQGDAVSKAKYTIASIEAFRWPVTEEENTPYWGA